MTYTMHHYEAAPGTYGKILSHDTEEYETEQAARASMRTTGEQIATALGCRPFYLLAETERHDQIIINSPMAYHWLHVTETGQPFTQVSRDAVLT